MVKFELSFKSQNFLIKLQFNYFFQKQNDVRLQELNKLMELPIKSSRIAEGELFSNRKANKTAFR